MHRRSLIIVLIVILTVVVAATAATVTATTTPKVGVTHLEVLKLVRGKERKWINQLRKIVLGGWHFLEWLHSPEYEAE
jgi:hypothetical protein